MPPSLESTVSEEILDRIIAAVDDQSTLYQLCLVSKTLCRISTPHLYEHVTLESSDDGVIFLLPFAHLIFSSPVHANLVKKLSIPDNWSQDPYLNGPFQDSIRDWPLERVARRKKNYGYPSRKPWPKKDGVREIVRAKIGEFSRSDTETEEWFKASWDGLYDDAVLALLLPSLPKLSFLELAVGAFAETEPWALRMLQEYTNGQNTPVGLLQNPFSRIASPFSKLSTVYLCFSGPEGPVLPVLYAAMLNLPTLKQIYSLGIGHGDDSGTATHPTAGFKKLKPRSSSVEIVEIRHAKFQEADLVALFNGLKPEIFKEFLYELGHRNSWAIIKHSKLIEIMSDHKKTLERLSLLHDHAYMDFGAEDFQDTVSFHDFTALKGLRLAPVFIWGNLELRVPEEEESTIQRRIETERKRLYKILPPSLEELIIESATSMPLFDIVEMDNCEKFNITYFIPAISEVLCHVPTGLQHLKRIAVRSPLHRWEEDAVVELGSLAAEAVAKGVDFEVMNIPDHKFGTVQKSWGWNEDIHLGDDFLDTGVSRSILLNLGPSWGTAMSEKSAIEIGEEILAKAKACRVEKKGRRRRLI